MVNIAFIHEKFPFGGGEVVTMNVIQSLENYGYRFVIFSPEFNLNRLSAPLKNVEYVTLQYKISDSRNLPLLISEIKKCNVDVFISPGFEIPYVEALKVETKCKMVYVNHNMPFWESIFKYHNGLYNASKSPLKWIEWYLLRSLKHKLGIYSKKLRKKYLNLYGSFDAFGVLCDSYGHEFAQTLGIEYESSKFVTLTNAAYPNPNYSSNKRKEICFVGRLFRPHKRIDRLIKIWQKLYLKFPDWELTIVGDGPDIVDLQLMVRELSLKRVNFMGYSSNPQCYYDRVAIVCLTSTFEGWPMTLIEAQANGCVAIAFDVCAGINEILSPSWENGVLVKPFDIDEYADALSRLMSDDNLRNRIAENGRQHVAEFSEERTAQQWINMINKLLQ